MGFKLKAPKISVPSVRTIVSNVSNTVTDVKKQVDKSDVGKQIGATVTPIYNVATSAPRIGYAAVSGGNVSTEVQKTIGGVGSALLPMGYTNLGASDSINRMLRNKTLSQYSLGLSENFAGTTQGLYTLNKSGTITDDNRNNFYQGALKVGAAAAVGGAAASYFGAPASSTGGAVLVESGAPLEAGALVTSSEVQAGALASASATGSVTAAAPAAASGSSGWLSSIGASAIGAKLLGNQGMAILTGGGINPDQSGGILDSIGNLFGGNKNSNGGSSPTQPSAVFSEPVAQAGISIVTIGIVAGLGFLAYRKFYK